MKIDAEFSELIPPMTEDEYKGLEARLLEEGCRDALVVWGDILVDGHNRYRICSEHGLPYRTEQKEFADREAALMWMLQNQLGRRNLNDFQRIEMVRKCERAVKAQAEKRMLAGKADPKVNLPEGHKSRNQSRDELGRLAGVSGSTYEHAAQVLDKASDEVKAALRKGSMSINQAYQQVRRAEKETLREAERQENAEKVQTLASPLEAQGLFQTVVIDPAWDWGDEGDVNQFGRARPDYHTMPIEEIEALPVSRIADENCHLYLWVTNRSLPKAFRLMEAWGFRYITCLTWIKPSIGMGNYFSGSTEQVRAWPCVHSGG